MKTLFMETTKIEPEQTVAQIQKVLGQYGAGAVMTEYDKGEVVALTFKVKLNEKYLPFKLPCRWESIDRTLMLRRKRLRNTDEIKKQAKRIAWRQILRWVEAQMALVETDMVKIQEVFMPYIQVSIGGQTLFEKLEAKGLPALEDKRE